MLRTFRARIKDNYVEWDNDADRHIPKNSPVPVYITILDDQLRFDEEETICQGKQMAAALNELAKLSVFREINDPVSWQRTIRQDRQLPGRHDAD